ncbi:GH92 family glycosyl hydrolase [Parafrankia discariae]|uniref:GH92 family glycosyl hydrolase n=1 Tax=Parafrankia discariae TaxID=365528 RepID=UPI000380CCB0|nr:GH92 family glycosyl hydrolase [Parafrankia discariae]
MAVGGRRARLIASVALALLVTSAALAGLLLETRPGSSGGTTRAADPATQAAAIVAAGDDLAGFVDPFIGTARQRRDVIAGDGVAGAFPGAAAPFGMVQWSPDTDGRAAAGSGGYRYADSVIDGFSLTHLHGTSCSAAQDVSIMPSTGPYPFHPPTGEVNETSPWEAGFSHDDESAAPGRYSVQVTSQAGDRIGVDLAAGTRAAVGRFSFPPGVPGSLFVDLGRRGDGALRADLQVDSATGEISGSVTSRVFCRQPAVSTLYFVARPDRPPAAVGTWSAGNWSPSPGAADEGGPTATSRSASVGAWLRMPPTADGAVVLRTAVSYTSVEGARANLAAEYPTSVDAVASATRAEWNRRLAAVRGVSASRSELRVLYTALYHAMLGPGAVSDTDGTYRGWDGSAAAAPGWTVRSGVAGWDAYRSSFPLLAMLAPDVATDTARSLLAGATQTGSVPGWTLATSRPDIMPGDGGTVLLAQAVALGLPVDPAQALATALASAARRPFAAEYDRLGFVPVSPGGLPDAVSVTLEYALADFATAQLALAANRPEIATVFTGRSKRWRSVWDPVSKLPAPRGPDGAFLPVEPTTLPGYTEGTAAQYSWLVPQDPDGLAEAMGGRRAAVDRLADFLTRLDDGPIGTHAEMGNQPSLLVPWLGASFGAVDLTIDALDRTRRTLFRDTPDGLPGNDDTGGLSAWYVLAWLGLGPVQPGTDLLIVTPPAVSSVEITLPRGQLRSVSEQVGRVDGRLPVGLRRDGESLPGPWIRFRDVSAGATLAWSLSDQQPTAPSPGR